MSVLINSSSFSASLRRQSGALKHNLIAIPLVFLGFLALVWSAFPPSYKTDLSQIGNGKPAIVLTFNKEDVASMELMEGFNQIRDNYEEHIEFFIADLNTNHGDHFSRRHNAPSATAVYFAGDGQRLFSLYGPQKESVLTNSIRDKFAL